MFLSGIIFFMKREFTATCYILDEEKQQVLLIYHRKLKKWLPAGGHVDPHEIPCDTARREALEETGIEVEILSQENIEINCWNAKSFPRPYLCLLEEIPPYGDQPAHQHMDMVYVGRPIGGTLRHAPEETAGARWFSLEDLQKLAPDEDIFIETLQVIQSLFLLNAWIHV